jgi:glycosyltransferase involved in cell wall biosynthesis
MRVRVLEVLATLKRAGAERVAVTLACRLDRARFETAVATLYDPFPGGFDPVLDEAGVSRWTLGKRPGFDPRMAPRLYRVMRKFRPAIVHSHSYVLRYSLPAAMAAGVGAMAHTVHNVAEKEVDLVGRWIQRFAFRGRVAPVAVAREIGRSIEQYYGVPPAAVIPNGIDAAAFCRPQDRAPWRRAHGFCTGDLLVASVARLEPQKDPLGLIGAFATALGRDPRAHLLLAGDGSLRGAAGECAAALDLRGRVHFLGVQSDIAGLLAAADLFVLFSSYEGNPVAVMEAMAAGLPVIASSVGGVPEIVAHGETGLLVPQGDREAFAASLTALAANPTGRRAMGESAQRRAQDFDAGRMVESYGAFFERLSGAAR